MTTARKGLVLSVCLLALVGFAATGAGQPAGIDRSLLDALNATLLSADPEPSIRALAQLHSLRVSDDFDRAAALVEQWAREAELEVSVEDFPADGKIRYGAFLSEPGWRVQRARLEMILPEARRLANWEESPLALAWFSGPAEVETELVDVGSGLTEDDYFDRDVRGKIVLADGPHRLVHHEAVVLRGAVGVASAWHLFGDRYPDLRSSDGSGIRPWRQPDGEPPGFVFSVSARTAKELRNLLAEGTAVRLRASVDTELYPSKYRVVSAVLPGTTPTSDEVLLVNHLDSTQPGAVHNAAAAFSLVEVGSSLSRLIRNGTLAPPRRALRFLWVPEHRGTMAYILAHPELRDRVVAAFNIDMPTARHGTTGAITHLYRTPDSTPSFADDVLGALLEWTRDHNTVRLGTDAFAHPVVSDLGSRESFYARVVPFEGLSDHVEFIGSGIPMGFFGAWPYEYLGTTRDTIDHVDATQLKRFSLVLAAGSYAIAAASGEESRAFGVTFLERAHGRLLREATRRSNHLDSPSTAADDDLTSRYDAALEALHWKADRERRALQTLSPLVTDPDFLEALGVELRRAQKRLEALLARRYETLTEGAGTAKARPDGERTETGRAIPERTTAPFGPLTPSFLRERLGRPLVDEESAILKRHPYAAFEVLNFVDGRRSVEEIRQAVSVELGPIPRGEVLGYLRALEDASIIRFRGSNLRHKESAER